MGLEKQEMELAVVAISVAAGCKPCADHHLKLAREEGATDDSIRAAVRLGAGVRRSAAAILEAHALGEPVDEGLIIAPLSGLDVLSGLGAALAVNSTDEVTRYLGETRKWAVGDDDLRAVIEQATFIRGKAISHAEKLVAPYTGETAVKTPCCGE
ncbi:MAG: hypothetical protein A2516_10685 [Alphaproteobacteria bacterium RIFOXYD12_FULL_60_8]|nr:MAG: hypothetical protein A2516_10685 [Alphaproteobacteria bacterium RIFOXYD12_FULL_60_8]